MRYFRSINWRHSMLVWVDFAHDGSFRRLPTLSLGCSVLVEPSAYSA